VRGPDEDTCHLWHGVTPISVSLRATDPGGFVVRGEASHLWDRSGRRYLDARSSMWNMTLGYSCEPVEAAMRRQAGRRVPEGSDRPGGAALCGRRVRRGADARA
jgi:adenosylmethionine-8-amino-7-oxononanoate aminotransferase